MQRETVTCPHCEKETDKGLANCVYCGKSWESPAGKKQSSYPFRPTGGLQGQEDRHKEQSDTGRWLVALGVVTVISAIPALRTGINYNTLALLGITVAVWMGLIWLAVYLYRKASKR